jgi:hypothetical protein
MSTRRHSKYEEIGRRVRQGCRLSPILLNLYSKYFTKEALEDSGDFKIEGKIIRTLSYGGDLVLLTEKEAVL